MVMAYETYHLQVGCIQVDNFMIAGWLRNNELGVWFHYKYAFCQVCGSQSHFDSIQVLIAIW